MTTQPIQAVLDPQSTRLLFDSLTYLMGASARDITASRAESLAWVAELAPCDRVQSALAVRVIALHHATMRHLSQPEQRELSSDLALRHGGRAVTASRMIDRALQARQVMVPMRAVALPLGIGAEAVRPAPEVVARQEDAMPAPVEVTTGEAAAPHTPAATQAAAPPVSTEEPAPVGSSGWVAKRLQTLEEKLARGKELTGSQREWLRRQMAAQGETSIVALAA